MIIPNLLLFVEDAGPLYWVAPVLAVLAVIGNVIQFIRGQRMSRSQIANLDAQTLKTNVETIEKIQVANNSLYDKMVDLRDKAEKLEDDLEISQENLRKCEDKNSCKECQEYLESAAETLTGVASFLSGVTNAEESVETIKTLSREMLEKVNKEKS